MSTVVHFEGLPPWIKLQVDTAYWSMKDWLNYLLIIRKYNRIVFDHIPITKNSYFLEAMTKFGRISATWNIIFVTL